MKNNIVLIGMPGAGKSTIGVLLAKAMNYQFMDTDLLIQKQNGKKLYEIINEKGIDEFLKIENDTIAGVQAERSVIATGGSAIFGEEAMAHLGNIGHIVYIKLSCQEIEKRINNIKTRGIAMSKGKTIADIYEDRVPLYEKYADIIVDCENTTIEESVERIVEQCNRL